MKPLIPMRAALEDPAIFGRILEGDSWQPWRVLLIAIAGEALTDEERLLFTAMTEREREPLEPVDEAIVKKGRRAGWTRAMAVYAAWRAGLNAHDHYLAAGERAILPVMSATVTQATKMLQYLDGIFSTVPALSHLVTNKTADTISLSSRVDVVVRSTNQKTIRGDTAASIIVDEAAFLAPDESTLSATEAIAAARPMLLTTGGQLLMGSSPHGQAGMFYEAFTANYGLDGDPRILVATGSSTFFNSTMSAELIDRMRRRDPARAASEIDALWRTDVQVLFSPDAIQSVVIPGRLELAPDPHKRVVAFFDAAGGSSRDSAALALSHREGDMVVVDLIREWRPPFVPEAIVAEAVSILQSRGCFRVVGDNWGSDWVQSQFKNRGISYITSDKTKSEIYLEVLPRINSGKVQLLDNKRLAHQMTRLERRVSRSGRETIDAPRQEPEDVANAVCGSIWLASYRRAPMQISPEAIAASKAPPSQSAYGGRFDPNSFSNVIGHHRFGR